MAKYAVFTQDYAAGPVDGGPCITYHKGDVQLIIDETSIMVYFGPQKGINPSGCRNSCKIVIGSIEDAYEVSENILNPTTESDTTVSSSVLGKGDKVTFSVNGKSYVYTVTIDHMRATGDNAAIFKALGMDSAEKYELANKYFGVHSHSNSGVFPYFPDRDYVNLTKFVNELHRLCKEKSMKSAILGDSSLKYNEKVSFTLLDKSYTYRCTRTHLSNIRGMNAAILLDIQKYTGWSHSDIISKFTKAYGYSPVGCYKSIDFSEGFPECKSTDYKALTAIVEWIKSVCRDINDGKHSISKEGEKIIFQIKGKRFPYIYSTQYLEKASPSTESNSTILTEIMKHTGFSHSKMVDIIREAYGYSPVCTGGPTKFSAAFPESKNRDYAALERLVTKLKSICEAINKGLYDKVGEPKTIEGKTIRWKFKEQTYTYEVMSSHLYHIYGRNSDILHVIREAHGWDNSTIINEMTKVYGYAPVAFTDMTDSFPEYEDCDFAAAQRIIVWITNQLNNLQKSDSSKHPISKEKSSVPTSKFSKRVKDVGIAGLEVKKLPINK